MSTFYGFLSAISLGILAIVVDKVTVRQFCILLEFPIVLALLSIAWRKE